MPNLLDFLFPKQCFGCGRYSSYICSFCLNKIKISDKQICPVCRRPAIGGKTHPVCQKKQSLDGLTFVFQYNWLAKKIIKKIKYRFIYSAVEELSEIFLSSLGEDDMIAWVCRKKPILIPVPLHSSRKRWRGFNQSEILGKIIARRLGIKFCSDLLKRTKNTAPQTNFKKKNRLKNIKGAFSINNDYSKFNPPAGGLNSRFLLFDDVWTTGGTMQECAKVLKRNGAKFVWGLTIAS